MKKSELKSLIREEIKKSSKILKGKVIEKNTEYLKLKVNNKIEDIGRGWFSNYDNIRVGDIISVSVLIY